MYERRKFMDKQLNQKGKDLLDEIVSTTLEIDEMLVELEVESEK